MLRLILIWLLLFSGFNTLASHVLGGELNYKHIKDNQYKVTLSIYRDCNGCKLNGTGGGNSNENCSEIDYIFVKGSDNTFSKETKFALTRESVKDISPLCRSKISTCNANPNTAHGVELHQFTSIIDLDNSKIKGFCKYKLYVTIAERNANITTGQSLQNFCIDAFINTCISSKNNSPTFTTAPTFFVNSNKSSYQSAFVIESDNDSLVYSLTPAFYDLDKEVNYGTGFSYTYPISTYCIESAPCIANKVKETGFFIDQHNGSIVFIPVQSTEIGIVALKIEEYRKISGNWELIGYVKRDYQINVKTNDGNNIPKFINKDYFEICEEEPLIIKIETKDDRNSILSQIDTNLFSINSSIAGSTFTQTSQNTAPYYYGLFKWTPPIAASDKGIYKIQITATDNNCDLIGQNQQVISIKVIAKEKLQIKYNDLGCGNIEIKSSTIPNQSAYLLRVFRLTDLTKCIFTTSKTIDTLSFLQKGDYLLSASLTSANGCVTTIYDTIKNINPKLSAALIGNDSVCKNVSYPYAISNLTPPNFNINWMANSQFLDTGSYLNTPFKTPTTLQALLHFKKGKWQCYDTLSKLISIIAMPKIILPNPISICHKSGIFELTTLSIEPKDGSWSSNHASYWNGKLNTNIGIVNQEDTVNLFYEISHSGCIAKQLMPIVLKSVPDFELSKVSFCEINSPIAFENLIKKPITFSGLTFSWNLPLFPGKIKNVNGFQSFYPNEIGFGIHTYEGSLTASNGCINKDTALIEITKIVKIKLAPELTICQESGSVNITELAGAMPDNGNWSFTNFSLFDDSRLVKTDTCGVFELIYIYDNYGCYDVKKLTLTIACKPEMEILNLGNSICDSKLPIALEGKPNGGIWVGNFITNNQFNPPITDKQENYLLTYFITDNLCQFKENRLLTIVPSPILQIAPSSNNLCVPESIAISGMVSKTHLLNFTYNQATFSINTPNSAVFFKTKLFESKFEKSFEFQSVKVLASNNEGCSIEKEFFLKIHDNPHIGVLKDTFYCENQNVTITPQITYDGNEAIKYSWIEHLNEIHSEKGLNSSKLNLGPHTLYFICSTEFCSDSKHTNIEIKAKPFVDFIVMPSDQTTITQPSFWFINQSGLNQNWLWNFGTNQSKAISKEANPKYSYSDTGNYTVSLTGTDHFGCSDIRYKTVVVRPDLLIFIPNAFSPNNKDEEKNNVFSVSLDNYNSYSIEIYDRWGHKLFYSDNPKETWDGKSGSTICTPDVYFYSVKINSISNNDYHYKGTILLLK